MKDYESQIEAAKPKVEARLDPYPSLHPNPNSNPNPNPTAACSLSCTPSPYTLTPPWLVV